MLSSSINKKNENIEIRYSFLQYLHDLLKYQNNEVVINSNDNSDMKHLYVYSCFCLQHQYHTKIEEFLERVQAQMVKCLIEKVKQNLLAQFHYKSSLWKI